MHRIEIDQRRTLYQITEEYEEALELLVSLGFDSMRDEQKRKSLGGVITLGDALKTKGISLDAFSSQLSERIGMGGTSSGAMSLHEKTVRIAGVLPCPVRIPLMEAFENWVALQDFPFHLDYELKAASMGISWIEEKIHGDSSEELPDLFISAGFDMFFDRRLFGKFKSADLFEDYTNIEEYHPDFQNDYMSLRDPRRQYSMIGVVPAVFLVNIKELGDRKMPASWADILHEDFRNSISLPVSDFDLFNAILLNIYKMYGEEGVRSLGRNMQKSMHPAEMVKSHMKLLERPSVTIMPYFFTKMVKEGGPMKAIWPEDGSIMSPIFLLSKKDKREELESMVNFLSSKEVGEILSHNGRFPSINPEVDNLLPSENRYMWLGWDFIENHDLSELIRHCEGLFNSAMKGEVSI